MPESQIKVQPIVNAARHADSRRIANVPNYEAALLAAEGLEQFCLLVHGSFGGGRVVTFSDADVEQCKTAIEAYREATK